MQEPTPIMPKSSLHTGAYNEFEVLLYYYNNKPFISKY